jgi:hypothetical protein
MRSFKLESIFVHPDEKEPVCCVCGEFLESWEDQVRLNSRMCAYHADQVDKDERSN